MRSTYLHFMPCKLLVVLRKENRHQNQKNQSDPEQAKAKVAKLLLSVAVKEHRAGILHCSKHMRVQKCKRWHKCSVSTLVKRIWQWKKGQENK